MTFQWFYRISVLFLFLPLATAATFFVSPRGNDEASGTQPSEAWKSIARVNRHLSQHGFHAGDAVLFKGGCSFRGNLIIDRAHGGAPSQPALVTSYGSGCATLLAGIGTGLLIRETPWITISNLTIQADVGNGGDGIRCDRNEESPVRIAGLSLLDCRIVGFDWHGIMIDAAQHTNGFEYLRIDGCTAMSNRYAGIMVYGGNPFGRSWYPHAHISIFNCISINNLGDPDQLQFHSGSGIFVDGVDQATISGCFAAGNGAECRNDAGGPVGIWAHASREVIIEHCESFNNHSCLRDGGGFDLDGGCEDSVMRWNFSHQNHGPGFLVYNYSGAAYQNRGCRVMENISMDDGERGSGYAGIQVGSESGCQILSLQISRNTIIAPEGSVAALRISGHGIDATIQSNLVIAPPHGILVSLSGYNHRLAFVRNRYWREDGIPVFLIDTRWAVASLGEWHNSTGPEQRFRSQSEEFVNPHLSHFRLDPALPRKPGRRWPSIRHSLGEGIGAPWQLPGS